MLRSDYCRKMQLLGWPKFPFIILHMLLTFDSCLNTCLIVTLTGVALYANGTREGKGYEAVGKLKILGVLCWWYEKLGLLCRVLPCLGCRICPPCFLLRGDRCMIELVVCVYCVVFWVVHVFLLCLFMPSKLTLALTCSHYCILAQRNINFIT